MDTKQEQIADTLTWLPTHTPMLTVSSADIIASSTRDILHALKNPTTGSPLPLLTDTETETLKQISILLNEKVNQPAEAKELTNNDNELTRAALRVPPAKEAPAATITNAATQPATSDTTYHESNQYKKQQARKTLKKGILAATQASIMETANYTAKILSKTTEEQSHNSDYICCYAIHPNTGLPAKYCELHNSSEGAEWIIETADEVGRLAQGN